MRPKRGIATDGAHSMKRGVTRYRAVNLATGELLFEQNIGNQTINIGEFLGVVEAAKYIIEHRFSPAIIYTDSLTALTWFNEKRTASRKRNAALKKAEIFQMCIRDRHGAADYAGVIADTSLAQEDEYKDLLNELKAIGYTDLRVVQRARPKFTNKNI